jgi:hypothetical protein
MDGDSNGKHRRQSVWGIAAAIVAAVTVALLA